MEIWPLFLSTHEARRLLKVPCSLCFIKESHVFKWRASGIDHAFLPEGVDLLNEHLHLAHRSRFLDFVAALFLVAHLIACKSFTKNRDKRPITREENTVELACLVDMRRRDIQPDERFPRAWNARHETN